MNFLINDIFETAVYFHRPSVDLIPDATYVEIRPTVRLGEYAATADLRAAHRVQVRVGRHDGSSALAAEFQFAPDAFVCVAALKAADPDLIVWYTDRQGQITLNRRRRLPPRYSALVNLEKSHRSRTIAPEPRLALFRRADAVRSDLVASLAGAPYVVLRPTADLYGHAVTEGITRAGCYAIDVGRPHGPPLEVATFGDPGDVAACLEAIRDTMPDVAVWYDGREFQGQLYGPIWQSLAARLRDDPYEEDAPFEPLNGDGYVEDGSLWSEAARWDLIAQVYEGGVSSSDPAALAAAAEHPVFAAALAVVT